MTNIDELLNLRGKVAVVTGGAAGIGLATARTLAKYGAKVAIIDIHKEQEAAADIAAAGGEVSGFRCDVTNAAQCEAAVHAIKQQYGRIDILFNNAGVIRRKSVVELEEREWDLVVDVSLKGAYLLSKYAIPIMAEGGGGSIVNTGSGWGLKGGDQAAAYCAAKAGIVNLTKAMAIDHGRPGIRVNCVCPGDTDTELLRDEARQLQLEEQAFLHSSADRPLARLGTPQDIANAVLFLASDMSLWVSGSVLVVDGGGLA
ncbi:SDR family oxidoreductase [Paenibacillus sp. J5C_2022]|uniref:SDR family NAD(P)-dependent oxidoreductase n=1 Tax=Paenibacillus sp. J5C2022 TaxID=2977129 RepID=UPI0021D31D21|nr:SDR family oxidoreductase [Paenibacillus sp. J5C2022]MCU6708401.1 SDR family oxidoreductase [Paenibacillus sp. J5C2022]